MILSTVPIWPINTRKYTLQFSQNVGVQRFKNKQLALSFEKSTLQRYMESQGI